MNEWWKKWSLACAIGVSVAVTMASVSIFHAHRTALIAACASIVLVLLALTHKVGVVLDEEEPCESNTTWTMDTAYARPLPEYVRDEASLSKKKEIKQLARKEVKKLLKPKKARKTRTTRVRVEAITPPVHAPVVIPDVRPVARVKRKYARRTQAQS